MLIGKFSHFISKVDVTKRGAEDSHIYFGIFGSEFGIFNIERRFVRLPSVIWKLKPHIQSTDAVQRSLEII